MADLMVIANPVSGGGRGQKVGEAVVRELAERGVATDLVFTQGRGHGGCLASKGLAEGCRRFAICGGDGTVHEVVGALATSDAALGIVPCGRGNDLARTFELPGDVKQAVDVLVTGVARRIDLGRIGDRYFGTVACVGFDAAVARTVYESRAPFSGRAAYVWAAFKALMTYRSPRVRIEGDFGVFEGPILLVAIGNTGTYGGGMNILPRAVCDDGLLDLCIVREMPRRRVLRFFPRIFSGAHTGLPPVRIERSRCVRIETSEPLWVFADGEPICQTPATIEVAEGALTVVGRG